MDVPGHPEEKPLWLSFRIGPHGLSLLWLSGVFLLGVGLTVRLSHRAVQDATFFFLTENDGLWVMDARGLSSHGDGFLGFALGAMESQSFLRQYRGE